MMAQKIATQVRNSCCRLRTGVSPVKKQGDSSNSILHARRVPDTGKFEVRREMARSGSFECPRFATCVAFGKHRLADLVILTPGPDVPFRTVSGPVAKSTIDSDSGLIRFMLAGFRPKPERPRDRHGQPRCPVRIFTWREKAQFRGPKGN